MKRGKYEKVLPPRRKIKRSLFPLVLIVLILTLSVGGTLAYILGQTGSISNTFTPGNIQCRVNDYLTITNTGNANAYIRAIVVVNWMDADGNVYGTAPTYTATTTDGWTLDTQTGIYYYNSPVPPDNKIPMPASITVTSENPDSTIYSQQIEVVAEAIQSEGMGADSAQNAWAKAQADR